MDSEKINKARKRRSKRKKQGTKVAALFWNILAFFVAVSIICVSSVFIVILINPQVGFNPFPPATLPSTKTIPTMVPPTTTPLNRLPPTWTPTQSQVQIPTATETQIQTSTPLMPTVGPSPTHTLEPVTPTPVLMITVTHTPVSTLVITPTLTPGGMPFIVQPGNPIAIQNIYHPELGCSWLGVGGQAFDLSDAPMVGLSVYLGGNLGGNTINKLGLTGTALQYGPAGYEFQLADHAIASSSTLFVQLLDQAGIALSDKVYFSTSGVCNDENQKNLILINFKQQR